MADHCTDPGVHGPADCRSSERLSASRWRLCTRQPEECRHRAALPNGCPAGCQALREKGGWIISTQFTLVPGKAGEPFISPHLKQIRPFLTKGDFAPGSWGQALVEMLQPADLSVEKVAYSAFYMTRLEWVLRKAGIETLLVCGIVTNGGVASTVRDAHVRDFSTYVLSDGCAAFSSETHERAIGDLSTVAKTLTCSEAAALVLGG
jgi:ureidoacrylate peracid hydrolase